MEGLRLFDPEAFNWLRWNRDFLFRDGRFVMSDNEVFKAVAERLKNCVPERSRDEVLGLLSVLFPSHSKWFDGNEVFSEAHAEVVRRRGIGCEAGYDGYFGLHPSSDAIQKVVIDSILTAKKDDAIAVIDEYLKRVDRGGKPIIVSFLQEIQYRFYGNNGAVPTQGLLEALFFVGEKIQRFDWDGEIFSMPARSQLTFLIRAMLERWGPDKAGESLEAAFIQPETVAVSASVFVDRARELGEIPPPGQSSPVIDLKELKLLGKELLPRIQGRPKMENWPTRHSIGILSALGSI